MDYGRCEVNPNNWELNFNDNELSILFDAIKDDLVKAASTSRVLSQEIADYYVETQQNPDSFTAVPTKITDDPAIVHGLAISVGRYVSVTEAQHPQDTQTTKDLASDLYIASEVMKINFRVPDPQEF